MATEKVSASFREFRFIELIRSFPGLRFVAPKSFADWDAIDFAKANAPRSGGERDAALFVLSVWDPQQDWTEFGLCRGDKDNPMRGRFDVHRAMGNWDHAHQQAFLAWCGNPFWM